jgi:hypothetical protein
MAKKPGKMPDSAREYLRAIGARGGSAKGMSKVRGTREHYRKLALARWNKQV